MTLFIGGLIGLMLSVSVDAEPLFKGQVRLSSGQPAADIQVRLFDLTDLRRFVGTTTDEDGHFALPLQMFSMDRGTALPTNFALGQNYPNPFNPSTVIPYQIPASAHVRLEVFNLLGQRLATLVDEVAVSGAHTAQWDATDAAGRAVGAGVYIYRLSGGGASVSRRMVLVDGQAGIPAVGVTTQGLVWSAVEGSVEADGPVYGLVVSGQGLVPYVDPTFRIGANEVAIVIEPYDGIPRMKIATSEILGDVDGNGRVDIIDALLVAMYSVDSSIPADHIPNIALGDVDADGDIDFTDAYLIGTYSVNPSDPTLPLGIGQAAPDLVSSGSETSVNPDTTLSHMYWADTSINKIQRTNLDGSNIKDLLTGVEIPIGIALDVAGGKMYWTDRGTHKIQRANLDGSDTETLVTGLETPVGIALDVDGGKMYWTAKKVGSRGVVKRANLDGSTIETLVTIWDGWNDPFGIALDMDGGKMYWTGADTYALDEGFVPLRGAVQRANLDGSNTETLVTGLEVPITFNPERVRLLWGSVRPTHVSEFAAPTPFIIALDMDGGKMYWTNRAKTLADLVPVTKIQRANLSGSNIETLVTGLRDPFGIALDVDGGKIYWTGAYEIQRANLDGSNIKTLVTGVVSLGIALDVDRGQIYWTGADEDLRSRGGILSGTGKVQRANLDGSNIETLITGLEAPFGITLDVDGGQIYWTDAGTGKVQRTNLDGSIIETLVTGLEAPFGIALDMDGGKMHWTSADTDVPGTYAV